MSLQQSNATTRDEQIQFVSPEDVELITQDKTTFNIWSWTGGLTAIGAIFIILTLMILLTIHTGFWSELNENHLSDGEKDQILGPNIELSSIQSLNGVEPVNFVGDVRVEGDVILNGTDAGTNDFFAVSNFNTITILDEIFLPDSPGSENFISLTQELGNLESNCSNSEIEELLEDVTEFNDLVVTESVDIFECLEDSNSTVVSLQESNTVRTVNHTERLDNLNNGTCEAIVATAINQTIILQNYTDDFSAINTTNINTDATLQIIQDIFANITAQIPLLANASCVVNETVYNTTTSQLLDLRTLMDNNITNILNQAQNVSIQCSAISVNITLLLDAYNATLVGAQTTLNLHNSTYQQYLNNITGLIIQHSNLEITVNSNNITYNVFLEEFNNCTAQQAALQTELDDAWTRYNLLLNLFNQHQNTFTQLDILFNQTYTQFNASLAECETYTDEETYQALLNTTNTLLAQYQTDYATYVTNIQNAQNLLLNISNFDAAITILENNATVISVIVSSFSDDLDTINATLISTNALLANLTLILDNVNTTLILTDTILTSLESQVSLLNTTLTTLQTLVTAQNITVTDHDSRLTILEAVVCSEFESFNQVADVYTAGENVTIGDVVALNRDGQVVKANNLYIKDAYVLDNQTFTADELGVVPKVTIDPSDHFYAIYHPSIGAGTTITLDGTTYDDTNNAIVKFSPVHDLLWVASTSYGGLAGGNSGLLITGQSLDPKTNTLIMVGLFDGDDEDGIDFINADGTTSDVTLSGFSPSVAGGPGIACVFMQLSSRGEWLRATMTTQNTNNQECYPYGQDVRDSKLYVSLTPFTGGIPVDIDFPGGITLSTVSSNTGYAWGAFDIETFTFDYLQFIEASGDTRRILAYDLELDSGNGAFVTFGWWGMGGVATDLTLSFPGVYTPLVNVTRSTDFTFDDDDTAIGLMRFELTTGDVYWATSTDGVEGDVNVFGLGGNATFLVGHFPDIGVDSFDRVYVSFSGTPENAAFPSVTYNGVTSSGTAGDDRAMFVMYVDGVDGSLLQIENYPYRFIGPLGNDRFEAMEFVTTRHGDMFFAITFSDERLLIDGTNYTSVGQTSSVIIKYNRGTLDPAYVYFDDYSELAYVVDSHGNLWSFLHENAAVVGDQNTFGISNGVGIVKLGQYELEPLGVVQVDASAGQQTRVVVMGEVEFDTPHGYFVGRYVYNKNGAIVQNVPTYGLTLMGMSLNKRKILVFMHRMGITQRIVV